MAQALAVHDPGKVVLDLVVTLALGGDCLADLAVRAEPGVYGRVASDPTVSRLIDTLAADAPRALAASAAARATARARVWQLAGESAPDHGVNAKTPLVVDVEATLVTAHSDKESARPKFKRGFGFHPLCAFVRPRPAGHRRAAGHRAATGQRRVQTPPPTTSRCCATPCASYRVLKRPHPGAQLRLTDADGHRLTAFATNTARGQLPDLELRHRRRTRAEDRIRVATDTRLTNLPLRDFAQNQIWCALVALALDLTAWTQLLALTGHDARRWEPKRLRLRLLSVAGWLAVSSRRLTLHLSSGGRWTALLVEGITRVRALPPPTPS